MSNLNNNLQLKKY